MKLQAKKSLGQHFLNSPSVLAKIVEAATIKPGETILEIGPGTGVLTRALLDAGGRVVAVEKDSRSVALLGISFSAEIANGKLTVHSGDILETDHAQLGLEDRGYALIANIPYYITGMILESFLEHAPRPDRMVLLVQKEVAERIVAKPDGNESVGKESILSISVKAFGTPHIVAAVPRGAFTPAPTVDSAILAIGDISDHRFKDINISIPRFFEIMKAGFAHKRKYARRNLEATMSAERSQNIWSKLSLNEKVRAEDFSLGDWFKIAEEDTKAAE